MKTFEQREIDTSDDMMWSYFINGEKFYFLSPKADLEMEIMRIRIEQLKSEG